MANENNVPEQPIVLDIEPNDRITFNYVEKPADAKQPMATVELKIKNPTTHNQLYKVKCTNNDIFKIRPPVGLAKPGDEIVVKLSLQQTSPIPQNDTHYFSIYAHQTDDAGTSPRDQWKNKKEEGRKRLFVTFQKAAA